MLTKNEFKQIESALLCMPEYVIDRNNDSGRKPSDEPEQKELFDA